MWHIMYYSKQGSDCSIYDNNVPICTMQSTEAKVWICRMYLMKIVGMSGGECTSFLQLLEIVEFVSCAII